MEMARGEKSILLASVPRETTRLKLRLRRVGSRDDGKAIFFTS